MAIIKACKEGVLQDNSSEFSEFWSAELSSFQTNNIRILSKNNVTNEPKESVVSQSPFPAPTIHYPSQKNFPNEQDLIANFIAACLIYFYRINSYQIVSTWLSYPAIKEISKKSKGTLSCVIPFTVQFEHDISFDNLAQHVKKKIFYLHKKKVLI